MTRIRHSMASGLRRTFVVLVTLALVLAQTRRGLASERGAHPPDGTHNYRSILGDAVNFGVVTEDFDLTGGDAQTNVAAIEGTATTQTGNDLTNKVEQTFLLARVDGSFRIKGEDAYVRTNPNDADKVIGTGATVLTVDTSASEAELADEVRDMLDHTNRQSQQLASQPDNVEVTYDEPTQRYHIDLTGRDAGTYFVTLDDQLYQKVATEAGKLRIQKTDDQTIVLNVTANAEVIREYTINGKGSNTFLDKEAGTMPQTIVWNFVNARELSIGGSVTGVILAPQARVTVQGTSSGWLVAQHVVIGSGEWHNVFQGVEVLREGSSVSFAARKTIDGADATVEGFSFALERQTQAGWELVESVGNEGAHVPFGIVTFDERTHPDDATTHEHLFRLSETQGTYDEAGQRYEADKTTHYARVRVTKLVQRLPGGGTKTCYAASEPRYARDEASTQPLEGLPTFDNTTVGESDPDIPDMEHPAPEEPEPDMPKPDDPAPDTSVPDDPAPDTSAPITPDSDGSEQEDPYPNAPEPEDQETPSPEVDKPASDDPSPDSPTLDTAETDSNITNRPSISITTSESDVDVGSITAVPASRSNHRLLPKTSDAIGWLSLAILAALGSAAIAWGLRRR